MEHIQGVSQLNEFVVTGRADAMAFFALGLLSIFLGLWLLYQSVKYKDHDFFTVVPILLIMFGGFLGFEGTSYWRETETRYQVVVEDTVSFNQFHSTYRILQIDGDIYTVLPK